MHDEDKCDVCGWPLGSLGSVCYDCYQALEERVIELEKKVKELEEIVYDEYIDEAFEVF